MNDTIYIVTVKGTNIIESVWETYNLALAAIQLHAHITHLPEAHYDIVERVINTTWKPK